MMIRFCISKKIKEGKNKKKIRAKDGTFFLPSWRYQNVYSWKEFKALPISYGKSLAGSRDQNGHIIKFNLFFKFKLIKSVKWEEINKIK